jgi:hypothetical protein
LIEESIQQKKSNKRELAKQYKAVLDEQVEQKLLASNPKR